MNIYDLISRAQKLRKETELDSVSPDRVGGLHEDTLKYINEFQLLASSPSLHKIYASVSAMQSDGAPKSDLTGKPLKPGQLVVIVPANQTDATAGDVYRYDGPSGNTSAWTFVAKIGAVPADAELSATSTNPPQNKVVTEKLTELESEVGYIAGIPEEIIEFDSLAQAQGIIKDDAWTGYTGSTYTHYIVPVIPNETYIITGNSSYNGEFAFLKSYTQPAAGVEVDFCEGTTLMKVIRDVARTIVIPSDCAFLYILKLNNGYDYTPASLARNEVKGRLEAIESSIAEIESQLESGLGYATIQWVVGALSGSGTSYNSPTRLRSEFVQTKGRMHIVVPSGYQLMRCDYTSQAEDSFSGVAYYDAGEYNLSFEAPYCKFSIIYTTDQSVNASLSWVDLFKISYFSLVTDDELNLVKEEVQDAVSDIEGLADSIDEIKSELTLIKGEGEEVINLTEQVSTKGVISDNAWTAYTQNTYTHYAIPVVGGQRFMIQAGTYNAEYAFLRSYTTPSASATAVDFCEGTGLRGLQNGATIEVEAPLDASFLYVLHLKNNADYAPSSLVKLASEGGLGELQSRIDKIITKDLSGASKFSIVDDVQNTGWIDHTTGNTLELDADYIMWDGAIRSSTSMQKSGLAVDMLNNLLYLKIKIHSIDTSCALNLYVTDKAGFTHYAIYTLADGGGNSYMSVGEWRDIMVPHTAIYNATSFNTIDFANIDTIRIVPYGGACDWSLQFVALMPKSSKSGMISFTFDDGYKSQLDGARILYEKGIPCTMFYIYERLGDVNFLNVEEMQQMANCYGTDIEVHGENPYTGWTDEDLISHWENSQKFLKDNGLSEGKHMAYPYGQHDKRVTQLCRRFFKSCRTISDRMPLQSLPIDDNFRLRAVSGVSSYNNTVDKVKAMIDKAVQSDSWLILVFHRIAETESSSMFCSVDNLKAIADYANASGATILNIRDAYNARYL